MDNKSYTEKDIVALRKKMIDLIKEETTNWSDFNESDLGMVLVDTICGTADMLNYYLDRQANEVFLDRAEEPKNIRSILNTMNYRIPFKRSAEGTVRFIIPDGINANDIVIPRYTELASSFDNGKRYVTKEERVLVSREEMVEVPVIQGQLVTQEVKSSRLKRAWKYTLDAKSLADRSVRVIDSQGEWEEVDDAFLQYKGGRYFSVHRDPRDKVYILFTWNWKDLLPVDDEETVKIQFLETLATDGRTSEFNIDALLSHVYDVEGVDVSKWFIINNPEAITGGNEDVETYKMIVDAKNSVRMMGKLVTLLDYTDAASAYNGIFKSVTQDWSVVNNSVKKPYQVTSWVISKDGEPFSESFLRVMSHDIYKKGISIVDYSAIQAEVIRFSVKAQIKIKSDNVEFRSQCRRQVIQQLQNVFGYGKMEFGQPIIWDDIRDVIKHTNNAITTVILIEPEVDRALEPIQYPALGSVEIEVVGDYYGL